MANQQDITKRIEGFIKSLDVFSPSNLSVGAGKILQYIYHRGYYLVAGPKGSGTDYALVEFGATRADGQTNKESIPVGSYVMYVYDKTFGVGYIIGAFNKLRTGNSLENRPGIKYRITDTATTTEPLKVSGQEHSIMAGDHIASDVPAAAFARTNAYGGAIILDKHLAAIQAKDSSGLVALDDGTVQITSETLFIRSFLQEYQEYKNKHGIDSVGDNFLSVANGLGFLNSGAMAEVVTKERVNPLDTTITEPSRSSLPSSTALSGETIDGWSKIVRTFKEADRSKSIPLFRETVFRDGSYVVQSAAQIVFEKFSLIEDPFKRLDKPIDDPKKVRPLEFAHSSKSKVVGISALGTEYLAYLLGTRFPYNTKLYWSVVNTAAVATTLGMNSATIGKANPRELPEAKAVIVDFEKNLSRVIYGSRSGIYLNDDGSVVIKDGYGSSITMGRGNITISPAKDLMLQVGQDVAGIVGGEVNLASMKGTTISSENGALSLNASTFLNLRSSATDGGVLVESKAVKVAVNQNAANGTVLDKGKPIGIVFKCDSGVVSVASNRYEVNTTDAFIKCKDEITIAARSASLFGESRLNFIASAYTNKISDSTPGMFIYSGGGSQAFMNFNGWSTFANGLTLFKNYVWIDNSLLATGTITGLSSAAFVGQPGELTEKTADSYKKSVKELVKVVDKFNGSTATLAEKARIADELRVSKLYLNDANLQRLRFNVASARKIPYEFIQTEWQYGSEAKISVLSDDRLGNTPMLFTNAIFYTINPEKTRVLPTGAYKEDTEPVLETELVKEKLVDKFTTNVSNEEYKQDPYDKV